jgi:putative oxidoreductase
MFSWSHIIADRVAHMFEKPLFNSLLAISARALMAFIFIKAGYSKIGGYERTEAYMAAMGVNPSFLPAVIVLELGGGLALLFGWQTRLAAAALAGFCVISGVLFHGDGEQMNQILLMKNLAMAGGLLVFARTGAGFPAFDRR